MAGTMFDIEKFDAIKTFNLWQVRMTTILTRLETLYVTMSLVNRLVLKQRLYTFRMDES
ncbi:hypothetical protein Godav_009206 [Gossypium davidsonii]|uniref:Uncharacterized protein n=1 Tax=Gossypium davidsonii TaxID=34287 RepID=A0A7J8SCD2_GOSDV|nr:hypothetical protein [Gossypium davidsonii]